MASGNRREVRPCFEHPGSCGLLVPSGLRRYRLRLPRPCGPVECQARSPRRNPWSSSCSRPKAARAARRPDRVLAQLVESGLDGIPIIALSEHVDYWDRLGWKDPFSAARFTDAPAAVRRRARARTSTRRRWSMDGHRQFVGSDRASCRGRRSERPLRTRRSSRDGGRRAARRRSWWSTANRPRGCRRTAAEGRRWLVAITEDGLESNVLRGENQGRHLIACRGDASLEQAVRLDAQGDEAV